MDSAFIILKANDIHITGESLVKSCAHAGTIACRQFHMGARTGIDRTGSKNVGNVLFDDFVVIKSIDVSSPLIYKALCENEHIDLEVKFFRTSHLDGNPEHFYSIIGGSGRITSLSISTPDYADKTTTSEEPFETIRFKFEKITFRYPTKDLEYSYSRQEGK